MQNKRDQLQAYNFVIGRLVSAIVRGEPDAPETPMRRSVIGTVIGVLLALLVVAGYGVFGLIVRGGNNSWREAGSIIVELETGTRYLYLDGVLRPTANYASARLAAGGEQAQLRSVSRGSLAGVPHGGPIGIAGAPDSLPEQAKLTADPWLVCASAVHEPSGGTRPGIVLAVSGLADAQDVGEDRAVLVQDAAGQLHLVWRDTRLKIVERSALVALGYGSVAPLPVDTAWLNALRAGPDVVARTPEGRGEDGPVVGITRSKVGQLFEVRTVAGAVEYYVVRRDGLSPVSQTDLALLLADSGTAAAYPGQSARVLPATAADMAKAQRSATSSVTPGYPSVVPGALEGLTGGARSPCVRLSFSPERGASGRLVTVDRTRVDSAGPVSTGSGRGDRLADQVLVPPGGGALVAAQAAPGVDGGAVYLVTDLGIKFPLPAPEIAAALGLGGAAPVPVPTTVLAFLPTGPVLDPDAARTEQRTGR